MKYLITGANGFLARELRDYWQESKHQIEFAGRKELDLTSYENVKEFFSGKNYDAVIHTAVKGGRRNQEEKISDIFDNLQMFENLLKVEKHYKKLFNFGSGAEFDRRFPIENAPEDKIVESTPADFYGLSKNLITRKILDIDNNVYNLRLFGCFGIHEENQRLFKNSFNRLKSGLNPTVHQNKKMDYFFAQDVGKVIDHIMSMSEDSLKTINKDINLCYDNDYTLVEMLKLITSIEQQGKVEILRDGMSFPYTGSPNRLKSLNIKLTGLEEGLKICLTKWNKS
jgi:GDP-L-fucose synthase